MKQQPDFIVIGAGSAGCVAARALAERGFHVTLIEAGENNPIERIPAMYPQLFGTQQDWDFETVPQPNLANRKLRWPRGRGPGGSTRINAMIWYPPQASDIQQLSTAGGRTWSTDLLADNLRQVTDWVCPEQPRWISEATRKFLLTSKSIGLDTRTYSRMTRHGHRFTAADLLNESPAVDRVKKINASVRRISFHKHRATGVELIRSAGNDLQLVQAKIAVILCAGTVASPVVLMQSGIGPRETFVGDDKNIQQVIEQVGMNLRDHLILPIVFATAEPNRFPSSPSCHDLARFQVAAAGPLASNLAEAGGLFTYPHCQTAAGKSVVAQGPDCPPETPRQSQLHVTPTHYLLHPADRAPAAMTIGVNLCSPKSSGRIRLLKLAQSPSAIVQIDPRYLSDQSDIEEMLVAIDFARSIAQRAPLSSFVGEELIPGSYRNDRDSLVRCIARYAQTLYHPTGTCRMGLDQDSVVDQRLAVRGLSGLHVIDASVLPAIPSVNPNAMVMMLALHAAKMIADSAM